MIAWPRKPVLYANLLLQNKFNNWLPPVTEKGRVKIRRRFQPHLAPTLVDPTCISVLDKVEGEKAVVQPETTPAGKKKK